MRAQLRSVSLTIALGCTALLWSCSKSEPTGPKVCCDQPKIPAGVPAFAVIKDDAVGPTDGQDVKLRVALKQKTKRDDIYPTLKFLYRYGMQRATFEPTNFVAEVYKSDADAQSGSGMVAKIWRERSDKGPKCENNIKLELPEQVKFAFDWSTGRRVEEDLEDTCRLADKKKIERFDDKFTHKASYKVDEARQAAEVTHPFLNDDGKDEYAKALTFNAAMTYWAEYMTTMFAKSDDLKELTFNGVWNDESVLKITVTREEFDKGLSKTQENVSAFAAITFAKLGMGKSDDKGARKEQEAHKTKTYKAALSSLPKERVTVSPKLKTG